MLLNSDITMVVVSIKLAQKKRTSFYAWSLISMYVIVYLLEDFGLAFERVYRSYLLSLSPLNENHSDDSNRIVELVTLEYIQRSLSDFRGKGRTSAVYCPLK